MANPMDELPGFGVRGPWAGVFAVVFLHLIRWWLAGEIKPPLQVIGRRQRDNTEVFRIILVSKDDIQHQGEKEPTDDMFPLVVKFSDAAGKKFELVVPSYR